MAETIHRFKSEALGNERNLWIREPSASAQPCQLAIFLDAEIYRDRVGAVAVLDELETSSAIARTLFVFVSVESWESRWKECPCHPPFARFIADELLPWLEAQYPALTGGTERALIGLSYTGLAAAFVALQSPKAFSRIIAQSGSFWWNDCWLVGALESKENPGLPAFYLDVGSKETAENVRHNGEVLQVVSQIEAVKKFRDALSEKHFPVEYVEFVGGHDPAAWRKTLPNALRWALPAPKPL